MALWDCFASEMDRWSVISLSGRRVTTTGIFSVNSWRPHLVAITEIWVDPLSMYFPRTYAKRKFLIPALHFPQLEIIPNVKGSLRWNKNSTSDITDLAKGVVKYVQLSLNALQIH